MTEYINPLNPPDIPPHQLTLKLHAVVILLRNLNVRKGLCNGSRLEVLGLHENFLQCKILTGSKSGEIEVIPRITLNNTDSYTFILSRHQFPIRLAFAMTINKSQGQTFEKLGLDLRTQVFAHGQANVGFSRARSFEGIRVRLAEDNKERKIKNIVYGEVLVN